MGHTTPQRTGIYHEMRKLWKQVTRNTQQRLASLPEKKDLQNCLRGRHNCQRTLQKNRPRPAEQRPSPHPHGDDERTATDLTTRIKAT